MTSNVYELVVISFIGLMVVKDAYRNKILWRKYVRYETTAGYLEGVGWLREHGFRIYGVVIDGLRGLAEALRTYPVQHCQFHQMRVSSAPSMNGTSNIRMS